MNRKEIVRWLEDHAGQVHDEVPAALVERCEADVRRHAAENAWSAARAYVEGRMHEWEHMWGNHASESSVARELCPDLARELKRLEPHSIPGTESELVGEAILQALEPEARERMTEWVCEVARDIEHRIWNEVVRFTRKEGKALARQGRVSEDRTWEGTENYSQKAAHIAQLLIEDYENQLASLRDSPAREGLAP